MSDTQQDAPSKKRVRPQRNHVRERKKIIAIDFDGVIHSYELGWQEGRIYGSVVPGFFEWAELAALDFQLVVYSSRSADVDRRRIMEQWIVTQYITWSDSVGRAPVLNLVFAHEKPPAWLTIDDRCVRFTGDWSAWNLTPQALADFKPWNVT